PIELEGTFPLPEAQLDRFLMRLNLGYPDREEERAILRRFRGQTTPQALEPVLAASELLGLIELCRSVTMHPALEDYILALAEATRGHAGLDLGASPRATLALYHTSQSLAAVRGRSYVLPDDVQALLEPVLAHRLVPSAKPRLRGETTRSILQSIVAQVPVPVEEDWRGGPAE
ncbi:MAG: MoxR family ATPase, partial [Chloroflexi bacterium]|nr:MoxR family ATPase [Chloroflexota bacterium]